MKNKEANAHEEFLGEKEPNMSMMSISKDAVEMTAVVARGINSTTSAVNFKCLICTQEKETQK